MGVFSNKLKPCCFWYLPLMVTVQTWVKTDGVVFGLNSICMISAMFVSCAFYGYLITWVLCSAIWFVSPWAHGWWYCSLCQFYCRWRQRSFFQRWRWSSWRQGGWTPPSWFLFVFVIHHICCRRRRKCLWSKKKSSVSILLKLTNLACHVEQQNDKYDIWYLYLSHNKCEKDTVWRIDATLVKPDQRSTRRRSLKNISQRSKSSSNIHIFLERREEQLEGSKS